VIEKFVSARKMHPKSTTSSSEFACFEEVEVENITAAG
jgi:hypothetical protein